MTSALRRQIAAYAESATVSVPDAAELGDLVSIGLQLADAIGASIKRWQDRMKAGDVKYQTADAQQYMDCYAELYRALREVEEAAVKDPVVGRTVDLPRLADMRTQLEAAITVSVEQMERAQEQLKRGEGRPLREVRDELRRRVGASGKKDAGGAVTVD